MSDTKPKAPRGLSAAGRALWLQTVADYELAGHELRMLTEACRTVDLLDLLEEEVRRVGPVADGLHGKRANPAAVEARQQRIALARLFAALRIPVEDDTGRTQSRPIRGVYGIKGAS